MLRGILLLTLLLLGLYGCGEDTGVAPLDPDPTANPDEPKDGGVPDPNPFPAAPLFEVPDIDGDQVALSDYEGQVVLVNFWATWCAPCRREVPDLVEIQEEYRDDGVVILGLSRDRFPDDEPLVRDFIAEFDINYPVLWDNQNIWGRDYQGVGMPTTFVLDRDLRIRFTHIGAVPGEILEAEIQQILDRPAQ